IVNVPFESILYFHDLSSVTCAAATDCWAVGQYYNSDADIEQTLIEHWDGTSWSSFSSPNGGSSDNYLFDVTCTSGSNCWAVGWYETGNSSVQTLIEHWNGTSWSIVPSPVGSMNSTYFEDVTCASTSNCWAVGYTNTTTLTAHWDGNSWSIISSANNNNG